MKNLLKNLGVMLGTGSMAILGFFTSMIAFKPESVTFKNDADNKSNNKNEGA